MSKELMQKLIAASLEREGALSLSGLRSALEVAPWPDKTEAKRMVAYAHLCCYELNPMEVMHAIRLFSSIKEKSALSNIHHICKIRCNIRGVLEIKAIGEEQGIDELKVRDFDRWFRHIGVKGFDLCHDTKNNLHFIRQSDCELIKELVSKSKEPERFWPDVLGSIHDTGYSEVRAKLLTMLASGQEPVIAAEPNTRLNIDRDFREYCGIQDITIIEILQEGAEGVGCCSNVYLVLDKDGIFKVYKELLDFSGSILPLDREDKVYNHLEELGSLPRYYSGAELVRVNDHDFIRMSVHYGQPLSDYAKPSNTMQPDEACYVISQIASFLELMHSLRVLYLDIKPENFLFDGNNVLAFDLGISRILMPGQHQIDTFPADPRFVTPECGTRLRASESSDIYQLGMLFHMLLTGRHPFAVYEEKNGYLKEGKYRGEVEDSEEGENRESSILRYAWPSTVLPYEHSLDKTLGDSRLSIISRMLDKDPERRPALGEIVQAIQAGEKRKKISVMLRGRSRKRTSAKNTILFVARMGIPHKGHIDYITRLLELGFHVRISIQRAYTITQQDPIPKFIVSKMVAQSLFDKGFSEDDFDIVLTPFFRTDKEHRMHFAMMPGREDIVAIASSNLTVWDIFPGETILDQRSVFGIEDEHYQDRSWGEIIRRAVREDDFGTFEAYAATGVTKILSFEDIKRIYGRPNIEFVHGSTIVVLNDINGKEVVRGRARRYISPEESIVYLLRSRGHNVEVTGMYSPETKIAVDREEVMLKYTKVEMCEGDEIISFQAVPTQHVGE